MTCVLCSFSVVVFYAVSKVHGSDGGIQHSAGRVQREVQGQNHKTAKIQSVVTFSLCTFELI